MRGLNSYHQVPSKSKSYCLEKLWFLKIMPKLSENERWRLNGMLDAGMSVANEGCEAVRSNKECYQKVERQTARGC